MSSTPVHIQGLSYAYGEGPLRRQVLFGIDAQIRSGEILILTGPSGSGKTTLLTLIGALRSVQEGSLEVLGQELRGAGESRLVEVRRRIGYIFQAHNLLDSLTAQENVQLTLQLHPEFERAAIRERTVEVLTAVGLGDRLDARPRELSGGERQRVAIARALAPRPELVLADEPTASLDRRTGRTVIELLQTLAKLQGVTVVLVTHDNRILDIADRTLALEDGRLTSLMRSVTSESQHMLRLLTRDLRTGHLAQTVADMQPSEFDACLAQLTEETRDLLEIADLVQGEAFQSVQNEVVSAIQRKLQTAFDAERVVITFVDPDEGSLRAHTMERDGTAEVRTEPMQGAAAEVFRTGKPMETSPGQHTEQAGDTRTGSIALTMRAVPVTDSEDRVFGIIELYVRRDDFDIRPAARRRLDDVARSLGTLLEIWWRMGCSCRRASVGQKMACCPPTYPDAPSP